MFTSLLLLSSVSIILNFILWAELRREKQLFDSLDSRYERLSRTLSELLKPKPEITAEEMVKKSKQRRPFTVHHGWEDERAKLEAQFPDRFDQALKQVETYQKITGEK